MLHYGHASASQSDPAAVAPYLFWLMFRNVASDGLVFDDPVNPPITSRPGCVLASPSWENSGAAVTQDYVYHWTRDAAIVAIELGRGYETGLLPDPRPLADYVTFSQLCQQSEGDFDRASFYIDGTKRPWTNQSDGPALQTIALLRLYPHLDASAQAVAKQLIEANLNFLQGAYQEQTYNLWEEEYGASFFARSVQVRCFEEVAANTIGLPVPGWLPGAVSWLTNALDSHWNGQYYVSVLPAPADDRAPYDPNIDVIMAAVYGAESPADPRLLATAARLREQWADADSKYCYPVNLADAGRGIGPLLGRYPGDRYDGDSGTLAGDHPWALATANFAELYYRLADHALSAPTAPRDPLAAPFYAQVGITESTSAVDAARALGNAGDAMLRAILYHSDHFELSEQFDAVTGFEKSVSNLSWSYAAYLSALRARGTNT